MALTRAEEQTLIVLLGDFTPIIFTPHWFALNGLLDREIADAAEVEVIHRDICAFKTSIFSLQVDAQKLQLIALGPSPVIIYDLVNRIFGEFLSHTNLKAAGINYTAHFRLDSEQALDSLGDAVAPKEPWGEWGAQLLAKPTKDTGSTRSGGLLAIKMEQNPRPDGKPGYIHVDLQPSAKHKPGVFMAVNDHYAVIESDMQTGSRALLAMIEGEFDRSIGRSKWLMAQVLGQPA